MLPNGAVLDDQHPNSAANWAGAITRGALDGLTGLADLTTTPLARGVNDLTRAAGYTPSAGMIALGKSGDGQLNTDLDGNHYNVPMADTAGQRIAGGIAGAVCRSALLGWTAPRHREACQCLAVEGQTREPPRWSLSGLLWTRLSRCSRCMALMRRINLCFDVTSAEVRSRPIWRVSRQLRLPSKPVADRIIGAVC